METRGVEFENWSHYKSCTMFIACPYCSFKCDNECGKSVCQNSELAFAQIKEVDIDLLASKYCNSQISTAIVFAGLEPFDSPEELLNAIKTFRKYTKDKIIIYTGYTKDELINDDINIVSKNIKTVYKMITDEKNIIIKYGRFIPDSKSRYDNILGITLASDNQYAEEINSEN